MRESQIEKQVTQHAEHTGWLPIKLNGQHNRGKPDHLFLKKGHVVFVEFKAPGEQPTKLQQHWAEKIEKSGHTVWVIDNVDKGRTLLNMYREREKDD